MRSHDDIWLKENIFIGNNLAEILCSFQSHTNLFKLNYYKQCVKEPLDCGVFEGMTNSVESLLEGSIKDLLADSFLLKHQLNVKSLL